MKRNGSIGLTVRFSKHCKYVTWKSVLYIYIYYLIYINYKFYKKYTPRGRADQKLVIFYTKSDLSKP